jgi:hypothetical protein
VALAVAAIVVASGVLWDTTPEAAAQPPAATTINW